MVNALFVRCALAGTADKPKIVSHLIDQLGDLIAAIVTAEPGDKAAVYGELGVTITYDPATHTAVAECSFANEPCGKRSCQRGELYPKYMPASR